MNNKMTINTYLSRIEHKKQLSKQEQRQIHGYREHFDGCQIGRGFGEMDEKGKGIKIYK